jgi:hypothetical protein
MLALIALLSYLSQGRGMGRPGKSSFIFKKFVSASRKLWGVLKNNECLKFYIFEFLNYLIMIYYYQTGVIK